jgi:phosphatidate cytidylyltransferase
LNGAADTAPESQPQAKRRERSNLEWLLRLLFGLALAGLAVGAAWDGKWLFALFLGAGSIAAVREWHRIYLRTGFDFLISAAAIAGALVAQNLVSVTHERALPWAILALGALLDLGLFRRRDAFWHGFGVLYIGVPPLSLLVLRNAAHGGFWLILIVFVAVWATDTGALIFGKLIGGPKLSPRLSPNKTWSGAFGGAVIAIGCTAILFAMQGANIVSGAFFGLAMSAVGQAGDLFESWIKRRVGRKNSGSLIPGHGGVLDRIDSILFVAPLVTFAIVVLGFNPLGQP